MDYKETLLLPATDFPMRGNLPQNEPIRYKKWDDEKIYSKMLEKRANVQEEFVLHDGPPYANGNTHIGHALNKTLKDIIVKYHYFSGKKVHYTPGWDCHGLPIEQQVEKKIGKEKKDSLPKKKFRELCREHAGKFIDIQRSEFKALGILGDFDNPYKTMDFKFEADIYRALCSIAKKGLLEERSKPVYWSWACTTALAEAEVEYKEKESDSIFVAFDLDSEAKKILDSQNAKLVIWTTTPWTLPANTGISLNPEFDYALTQKGYIVAADLHSKLSESGVVDATIVKTFKASILEYHHAINPLNGRPSKVLLGEHVALGEGSGAVHTAPGHGEDDYRIGLKYELPILMPVDDNGLYDETIVRENLLPNPEEFVGMHIFDANKKILELLGEHLLSGTKIKHSYPHCWRSHQPIIFRATKQWFILLDKKIEGLDKTLREVALEQIEKTAFYPAHGINRLRSMIENRPDWCISRQRDWGVPIAFFRDKKSDKIILDNDVLEHLAEVFEKEGADAWWSREISELLPKGCGYDPNDLEKNEHILDVWFDSGSTWRAVLDNSAFRAGKYPADMYLEGSDQHRGWFQSSLLVSCAINGIAPYKSILTHGFTMDENGEKMSKSKGNVIAPAEVIKELGSEILRLWVAMSDYQSDQKISMNILKQVGEQYKKLRNTIRFLLANINDLEQLSPIEDFNEIDKWIMQSAKETFEESRAFFNNYDFAKGLHLLSTFVVNDLSGIYMDICKDRLYCDGKESKSRRTAQSAMAMILDSMLALLAPFLTYTVDEALEYLNPAIKGDRYDVSDLLFVALPEVSNKYDFEYLNLTRERFSEIIDKLKKEKKIKSTLELELGISSEKIPLSKEIADWFMVSDVCDVKRDDEIDSFELEGGIFKIYTANKHKCPRCWKFTSEIEETVCKRCEEVVNA